MTRMILVPALLLSSLAFAATPAAPATDKPAAPTTSAPVAKAVFKDVDTNKDGVIEKSEIAHIADLTRDFANFDNDHNGKLSEAEYVKWANAPAPVARAVFEDLDANKDSILDKAELAKLADVLRDFNIADTDKNGKLSKPEYTAWVEHQKQM